MQLFGPVKCERCNDGTMASGKTCAACRGSGLVYLVPAERPRPASEVKAYILKADDIAKRYE